MDAAPINNVERSLRLIWRIGRLALIYGVVTVVALAPATWAAAVEPAASLDAALSSIFSPRHAPPAKTMGLLQRTFLDLVEESRPKLQIALVIDGTQSMGEQIGAVQSALSRMMSDLALYRENAIEYQLVVYRDVGAESGAVVLPLSTSGNAFTDDRAAVLSAVKNLRVESGAPYFPELVDQGLSDALTKLRWADDPATSRWIFLFGDAPPFDASFDEPKNRAGRRVATDKLIALADTKDIRISCILCNSRDEDQQAHQELLTRTRRFMSLLSSKTGGLMLDLSYTDIRRALQNGAEPIEVTYQKIDQIKRSDIEQVRRAAERRKSALAENARVKLAVLPHMPLSDLSFDPDREEVRVATELRLRLRALPGVELASPVRIERQHRLLSSRGLEGNTLVQFLGRRLGVDYIILGTMQRPRGVLQVRSSLFDIASGRMLIDVQEETNGSTPPEQLGKRVAERLLANNSKSQAAPRLATRLAALQRNADLQGSVFRNVSNPEGHASLLSGIEALEQALAYPVSDPQGAKLVDQAFRSFSGAVEADPSNPLAHFMLSSSLFNRAKRRHLRGDLQKAEQDTLAFASALRKAQRFVGNTRDKGLKKQIEADFALLILKKPSTAIPIYKQLATASGDVELRTALYANWMLGGIYSGDWGVGPEVADPVEARKHLVEVLAHWPSSPEAAFIRRQMRWDETRGTTRFQNYPRENTNFSEQLPQGLGSADGRDAT